MSARWIDSHCHLQDQYRPEEVEVSELVREANEAGVTGVVCVGTDARSSEEAVALAERLRSDGGDSAFSAWATVGLHPHEASNGTSEIEAVLDEVTRAGRGSVVGVGECGLDYHYEHSPRDVQRETFATQIGLAREQGLALVVHSREAWDDTLDILRAEKAPERTVLHCFTGGPDEARKLLELGAYISFSGIITFKNASEVREAAQMTPLDRMLIETDAPFLAPVPHRGKPNRPAWVSIVGEAMAKMLGLPDEDVAAATVSATRRLFSLP